MIIGDFAVYLVTLSPARFLNSEAGAAFSWWMRKRGNRRRAGRLWVATKLLCSTPGPVDNAG